LAIPHGNARYPVESGNIPCFTPAKVHKIIVNDFRSKTIAVPDQECIFCAICEHRAPADIVYEDRDLVAFRDIKPVAPVHILIIPRKHIPTLNDLGDDDGDLISRIVLVVRQLARQEKIAESGYRLVNNCNRDGGQEVYHLHFHLIGGTRLGARQMGLPR